MVQFHCDLMDSEDFSSAAVRSPMVVDLPEEAHDENELHEDVMRYSPEPSNDANCSAIVNNDMGRCYIFCYIEVI